MNNIDILEELKKNLDEILKEPMGKDEMSNGNLYEYERGYELDLEEIKAISNLIAENKELKEKIKEINEEYNAEQKHEMENTIPKSKIRKKIEELTEKVDGDDYWKYTETNYKGMQYQIEVLQELLDERSNTDV